MSDVYSKLTHATFQVKLKRGSESYAIECREIPFTTLMSILAEVATSARDEIIAARERIMDQITKMGAARQLSAEKIGDIAGPIVTALVFEIPKLTERFLLDVLVDADAEKIKLFTIEDVVSIVDESIKRIDVKRVSKRAHSVFSGASELVEEVLQTQAKKETEASKKQETAQKSAQQKQSPPS
jgi:hypothetical protein